MPKTDDRIYDAWKQCNDTVIAWIFNVLSPTICQGVIWLNTTKRHVGELESYICT